MRKIENSSIVEFSRRILALLVVSLLFVVPDLAFSESNKDLSGFPRRPYARVRGDEEDTQSSISRRSLEEEQKIFQRTQKGKSKKVIPAFVDKSKDPWIKEEISPEKKPELITKVLDDTTPPTPPTDLSVANESLHIVFCTWGASEDLESGIDYYVFGVGTEPGEADIKWWQSTSLRRKAYFYPLEYDCEENDIIYMSVKARNNAGLYSETVSSEVTLAYETLGDAANNLHVAYADYGFDTDGVTPIEGWSEEQIERFEHFTSRMVPIIKEIYGPPARDYTVTLVRNLYYSSSNIFFSQYNEIHMDDSWYPQLLTHELVHAFRDNVTITCNQYWQYDNTLSGFEEGFAQGVSYACMNRYIELYPDDPYVSTSVVWLSDFDWDYDFQNVEELRTTDFWSDFGGTGIYWRRYEMAAAAMRKVQLENSDFYALFNEEWYERLNADKELRSSRGLVVDIIEELVPVIEGKDAEEWINEQYVFDCQIHQGKKIWVRTQHYPYWQDYRIYQWIYYYETFSNGSEWAYWDGQQWVYHQLNGSEGQGVLYDFDGDIVWQGDLLIEPVENPPDYLGIGQDTKGLTNVDTPPSGDPDEWILSLHELNLYRIDITFDETAKTIHRVVGDELVDFYGVWGGIKEAQGGIVHIDHEGFPEEEGMPVVNGAFYGERSWAGVYNSSTGYHDTVPGKVYITYVNDQDNTYYGEENIDRGSLCGNHTFLLDLSEMTLLPTPTPTCTPTITPSPTNTPTITLTATPTQTPTITLTPTVTQTPTITSTPTISPTSTPSATPTVTLTPTVTPTGVMKLVIMKKEGVNDTNLYYYNSLEVGDWNYWDAKARNPSPFARDLWVMPVGNDAIGVAAVRGESPDNLYVLKKEGANDVNLYLYRSLVGGDWVYWDAKARNPSPLARDLWVISAGNDAIGMASMDITGDDTEELAILKKEGEADVNIYYYNTLVIGDWVYWDAKARNPSPVARDFWVIPAGNDAVGMAAIDVDNGDKELAIIRREGTNDLNLYIYNNLVAGDWNYWDAKARNPSPLARDLWVIPVGNDAIGLAAMDIDQDGKEELSILKKEGAGDVNIYYYRSLEEGDWNYWDAKSRNPSPFARDLWVIPVGNDAVGMTAIRTE